VPSYDAFISYSHGEDRGVARRLQRGVERFAKPWHRTRSLRVFLDTNSLSADPGLWSSVERALESSSWFVLIASPRAAASKWVEREVRWWLDNRSPERLLVVVADGVVEWDEQGDDFSARSTALPQALYGRLKEEPRWVTVPPAVSGNAEPSDLEMRETVIDVATALRGIPKEELVGAAAREHRRTMLWVRGVIAGLSLLLLIAIGAGVLALAQRSAAVTQARLALSRQVASASESIAGDNLSASMLFAVAAFREDPNPQTRAALFAASTSSPHLERFLDAEGEVEKLVGSEDGDIAAGLADGRVLLWREGTGRPKQLFDLQRRVSSLAISRDGSVIAAADRAQGALWREGAGFETLPVPVGQHTDQVALSPSGLTLVYRARFPGYEEGGSMTVAASTDPTGGIVHSLVSDEIGYGGALVVPSEQRIFELGGGSWRWRQISGWSVRIRSEGGFGAHQYGETVSADGRYFTATNGADTVPVWATSQPTPDLGISATGAEAPITNQRALALDPDGSRMAVAGTEGILVTPVVKGSSRARDSFEAVESESPLPDPLLLTGQGGVDVLAFAGETGLLSAVGKEIGVWDLEGRDRLAAPGISVPLTPGCSACAAASMAVSPDGDAISVADGFGSGGFVQSLRHPADREDLPESDLFEYSYGSPVWEGKGSFVAYPLVESSEVPADLPDDVRAWHGAQEGRILAAAASSDGETLMIVDEQGDVYWQDAESGEEVRHLDGPSSLSFGGETLESAALMSSPEMAALVDDGQVIVEELPSGRKVGRLEGDQFTYVAFAGGRLLLQRDAGPLEVWSQDGSRLQREIAGDETYGYPPVATADGSLAARRRSNGSVVLVDLDTGVQLATFLTAEPSSFLRTSVSFAPDGSSLYMLSELSGEDHAAELVSRDISDRALVDTACEAAGRGLSAEEWRVYVGEGQPPPLGCADGPDRLGGTG
jgi:WD40 repeat protein